jgi:DNA repair protein RadD
VLLRPRQQVFVERCVAALDKSGNTAGIAPTGAGKTIMLSAVAGKYLHRGIGKAIVLQHRDELLTQNCTKLMRVVPDARPTVYNAERKDWRGNVVFASEPTLRRADNLDRMPSFDLAVIDEAHHIAADGYQRIISRLKENNPSIKLFGVTATPNRGDKKALEPTFDNVGDQITIQELIKSGHLVRPRTFVKDVGIAEELKKVKKTVDDFDMNAVADIMNKPVINEKVVEHWQELAGNRRTVAFCSTIEHAADVMATFRASGVSCDMITGELPKHERRSILKAYANGEIRVLVNVAVLTEGWDDPPTSCVILLRPSSYKSTYLQMVGRGLRTVNPDEHPGVVKTDCIILDFGRSTLAHGSLEQTPDLKQEMACPACGFVHPKAVNPCPSCGFDRAPPMEEGEAEAEEAEPEGLDEGEPIGISDFVMTEVDLMSRSSWRWIDPWDNDDALMASGFEAWVGIFWLHGTWYAIGGHSTNGRKAVKYLGAGERIVALAIAEDFLNDHETDGSSAHKSKRWLKDPASEKQLALLGERPGAQISKYQAACLLNFKFNRHRIMSLVQSASDQRSMAA